MLIMFLEESLFQYQLFIVSKVPITEKQFISTSQAFLTSEELETLLLNQDQHEIALPLTKGKIAVALSQYENYYWSLQQAYDVLKCIAKVYFSETDEEKLFKLKNSRVHAHAPVLPSHLSLKANDCDLPLVDDDLNGDAQESDD